MKKSPRIGANGANAMRVVIDTNVITSSLLNPIGVPGQILSLVLDERLEVCYDARILHEYREVCLRPPFGQQPEEVDALIDVIKSGGLGVVGAPWPHAGLDADDLPFIEVAAASQAQFLITGNTRHFPRKIGVTRVITPADFMRIYLAEVRG